ncbi:MAG: 2-C-methyl-D-erythritol 4-phosphate cytidylyltransferase, partial [Gammaproteobacteria bacterium]
MAVWAIIPAAGNGERFGGAQPKQYLPLAGRPMLGHVVDLFLASSSIAGVAVALAADDNHWPEVKPAHPAKPVLTAIGGATRADSVLAALAAIADRLADDDWVLVHDAARPCLDAEDMERLIATLADDPVGGILAAPVVDTLKHA